MQVEVLPGGYRCIFMQYLNQSDGWQSAESCDIPFEQLKPAILGTIEKFHSEGVVHSDLRPCNILVR